MSAKGSYGKRQLILAFFIMSDTQKGFTMIELIAVMVIMTILATEYESSKGRQEWQQKTRVATEDKSSKGRRE